MPPKPRNPKNPKPPAKVEAITHADAARRNLPTAQLASVAPPGALDDDVRVAYERRNRSLDPQLVWRGKDEQDWTDLVAPAPPIYIEEKIHPKALIADLTRYSLDRREETGQAFQTDLFADFNGLPEGADKTAFYQHDARWSNRMILGDSLQAMASLSEREGLRGKVQCIYIDPPYGIRFNSNFQWSTTSRDVRDGDRKAITREPEQVKAFRDTWRDGVHSYLAYLRDRLTAARDLLADSGSVFVQISDENVHRVRAIMDEVFGEENFVSQIVFTKTRSLVASDFVTTICDYILWYANDKNAAKMRKVFLPREDDSLASHYEDYNGEILTATEYHAKKSNGGNINAYRPIMSDNLIRRPNPQIEINWQGREIVGRFRTSKTGIINLLKADRILFTNSGIRYKFFLNDFAVSPLNHLWQDVIGAQNPTYVVQTNETVIQRCILMTTDPGDLVLDPTCGAGTTAYIAEQWGRRWITMDTSRVALALARMRIMGARYPYYILRDSPEGQRKEAELRGSRLRGNDDEKGGQGGEEVAPTYGNVRQGFVYQRVPHVTLRDIANNGEIDVIWEERQAVLEPLRAELNAALGQSWEEWEIPASAEAGWPEEAVAAHRAWREGRLARQREIDASIARNAAQEYLYDKPYVDGKRVRVAGPFTVESLSPHRAPVAEEDANGHALRETGPGYRYQGQAPGRWDFAQIIMEDLKIAGVQQARKEDRIRFTSLVGWPGRGYVCAEGRFTEGESERRCGIFIGPEFGTVSRADLTAAAREAAETGFDLLIACAFSYDGHCAGYDQLGRVRILRARMNADLHMSTALKATDAGNLFVIFGEPDIKLEPAAPAERRPGAAAHRPGAADGHRPGAAAAHRPGAADDAATDGAPGHRPGAADAHRSGAADAHRSGAADEHRPGAADGAAPDGAEMFRVRVLGVDVFRPSTGRVESSEKDDIACWFVDTDYNEESFFVRQAYFLGANADPYKALRTSLRAEIDEEAWASLRSDVSRPFPRPSSGRIAVKVINHLGDEVMKVISFDPPAEGRE